MKKIIMALMLLMGVIGFSEEEFSYKGLLQMMGNCMRKYY